MYATMTMFTTKPGMRERVEKLVGEMAPGVRSSKGFRSITFFSDPEANAFGGFAVWESKEDAEAALAATGPRLQEALSGIVTGPPTRRVFEVYEPKA